ncbi:MAG TPA: hypothetical protein VNA19_13280 [Pyrinomonadaceae bacterium]|nr:hypothetical protein [Pyrinomonadaceae bacterium]
MPHSRPTPGSSHTARAALLFIFAGLLFLSGCKTSSKVSVPQLLTPVVEADTPRLLEEINRLAAVRSLRGKVDIQFLDTSFAKCGVAEKYKTADGTVTLQRPGHILLVIQVPFIGTDVAQMTSDGEHFRVAVLQGEERYKRFVKGTNNAVYPKLEADGAEPDCGDDDNGKKSMNVRAVSALSSLRPQHVTDALMVLPVAAPDSNLIYAQTESFEEEADTRPKAKKGARVVRAYYMLVELRPEASGRARVLRRFWFDRVGELRLARLQTYDDAGRLATDVIYREPKAFGEGSRYNLPSRVELTRPQDRYSLRITYQTPEAVKIDQPYPADVFDLKNSWNLPEVNLDERTRK